MEDKMTVKMLLEKFDHFRRDPESGNVILHTGIPHDILELKEEYIQELKHELENKINMTIYGMDELSAITKFAIIILQTAY